MIFQVKFKGPYDSTDSPKKIVWIHGTNEDEIAAIAFRQQYPHAEQVEVKTLRGNVIEAGLVLGEKLTSS